MRSVPCRDRTPGGGARPPRVRPYAGNGAGRAGADRRDRRGDARCLDLRTGADRLIGHRVGHRPPGSLQRRSHHMIELPIARTGPPARLISLTVDDQPVEVPEGSTVLDACNELGIDTPTLCYG